MSNTSYNLTSTPHNASLYIQLHRTFLASLKNPEETEKECEQLPSCIRDGFLAALKNPSKSSSRSWDKADAFKSISMPELQKKIEEVARQLFNQMPKTQQESAKKWAYSQKKSPTVSLEIHDLDPRLVLEAMEYASIKETLTEWAKTSQNREMPKNKFLEFLEDSESTELDLNSCMLDNLPNIFQFTAFSTRLQTMDLSSNQITAIPESIGKLLALRELDLSDNQLTTIPEAICELLALKEVHLANNQIKAIPESIGKLLVLQDLNLANNQIKAIPESIVQLLALQLLNLSDNQLTAIPTAIGELLALKHLCISNNQITAIPEAIGKLLALQELDLSDNQLTTIPEAICELLALEELDISWNSTLTGLHEKILRLPDTCTINLEESGLSLTVIQNLAASINVDGYCGPRITFSVGRAEQTEEIVDTRTIEEILEILFEMANKPPIEFSMLLKNEKQREDLRIWLSRLSDMQDYKMGGEIRTAIVDKVLYYLELAETNETFRNVFFPTIDGAATTCGDRIALSILHLGLAYRETTIDLRDMKTLGEFLIRGPWAINQLETIARDKVRKLRFFDEIEVYLGYPIQLKNRLRLQIDVQGMLFFGCSCLKPEDIDNAEHFIKGLLAHQDSYSTILAENTTWIKALKLNYPEEIRVIEEQKSNALKTGNDYIAIELESKKGLLSLTKKALQEGCIEKFSRKKFKKNPLK